MCSDSGAGSDDREHAARQSCIPTMTEEPPWVGSRAAVAGVDRRGWNAFPYGLQAHRALKVGEGLGPVRGHGAFAKVCRNERADDLGPDLEPDGADGWPHGCHEPRWS